MESVSLAEGIRQFEKEQRNANLKLTAHFDTKEKGRSKYQSVYFTKPEIKAKFDYFK